MVAVRFVESLKYAGVLYVYLLSVVVLGGGGLAIEGVLSGREAGALRAGEPTTQLVVGAVLVFLGASVLVVGTVSLVYKLVADAASEGVESGTDEFTGEGSGPGESTAEDPAVTSEVPRQAASIVIEADNVRVPSVGDESTDQRSGDESAETEIATESEPETPAETQPDAPEQPATGDDPSEVEESEDDWSGAWHSPERERDPPDPEERPDEPIERYERREQTAEEIAFGTATGEGEDEPESGEPAGDASDGETDRDSVADASETPQPQETGTVDDANDATDSPQADPLSERFVEDEDDENRDE